MNILKQGKIGRKDHVQQQGGKETMFFNKTLLKWFGTGKIHCSTTT